MSRPATHPTTDSFLALDINRLRRCGCLKFGRSGWLSWGKSSSINYRTESGGLRLDYAFRDEHISELIALVYSPTNFSSRRAWFECPSCRRQCGKLYGGRLFRCRVCWHATYESQRTSQPFRISTIRWRMRERLEERGGCDCRLFGLDDGFPPKPPRMHWRTYRRLEARDQELERKALIGISAMLNRLERRRVRYVR